MRADTIISIRQELVQAILEGAKRLYPREEILLLRGKKKEKHLVVSDLVVPPIASRGRGFSSFPSYMLPVDFSIVGTVHSHPSGSLSPSPADLNHFFGKILMITAYPFRDVNDIAAYDGNGEKLALQVSNG